MRDGRGRLAAVGAENALDKAAVEEKAQQQGCQGDDKGNHIFLPFLIQWI